MDLSSNTAVRTCVGETSNLNRLTTFEIKIEVIEISFVEAFRSIRCVRVFLFFYLTITKERGVSFTTFEIKIEVINFIFLVASRSIRCVRVFLTFLSYDFRRKGSSYSKHMFYLFIEVKKICLFLWL